MRAVIIPKHGGPEVFRVEEKSSPQLQADGVRIAVKASGINFADTMMRMGLYPEAPPPPFVPGYEISGVVTELGHQAQGFKLGDRVLAPTKFGGYCSEICLPAWMVRKIPASLSFEEAASIPVNYMTAWVALHDMARIRAGDRVLIQSAAGGVGVAAVQLAARAGAQVVGLVGSDSKKKIVLELGATEVWLTSEWESQAKESERFDAILDPTGGPSLKRSFRRLRPTGRVISFGVSNLISGEKRSLLKALQLFAQTPLYTPFKLMNECKGVYGLNMLNVMTEPQILAGSLDQVLRLFEEGQLKAHVGAQFPAEKTGDAHRQLQSRGTVGKVVITWS